jgi:hypothetical protein
MLQISKQAMSMARTRRTFWTFAGLAAAAVLLAACGNSRDRELEEQINEALISRKTDLSTSVDLTPYLGKSNVLLCVQGSYLEKEDFEKLIGRSAPGFEYLGGKGHALWLFYEDRSAAWVLIENRTMGYFPSKQVSDACTSFTDKPRLRLVLDNGIKKFHLPESE